jgi:hypothetical protein
MSTLSNLSGEYRGMNMGVVFVGYNPVASPVLLIFEGARFIKPLLKDDPIMVA